MNNKSEKDSSEQKIKQESDQFIESIAQQYPIEQVRDPNRDPDTLKSGYKELQFVLQSKFEHYQERAVNRKLQHLPHISQINREFNSAYADRVSELE